MNVETPLQKIFQKYADAPNDHRRNELKEIVQEITLAALDRSHFFKCAAFYGGTALRIFHALDRFSEDLDFSLLKSDPDFELRNYLNAVRDELGAFGFEMEVEQKEKSTQGAIQSAFIKGGTLIHFLKVAPRPELVKGIQKNELLKIKIELDTDPPPLAEYEIKYRLTPVSYSARLYDLPSLFAGKLHALICRNWKTRSKGRDFYDYLWYLSMDVPLNIAHFEARLNQSNAKDPYTEYAKIRGRSDILALLEQRFESVDYEQIKADVMPFVKDPRQLELWCPDFFTAVSREKLVVKSERE